MQFASYLEQAFPRAKVIRRNGAIPATSAAYTYMCLELAVDEQVDLLFIEFTMNDGFEEAIADNSRVKVMERLVRKAMGKPHAPAVALMQVSGGLHGSRCGVGRCAGAACAGSVADALTQSGGKGRLPSSLNADAC
jgi:hypothetical protein